MVQVSLAVFLLGRVPSGHPIVPTFAFGLPLHYPSHHARIATTAAAFGGTYTVSGTTPGHKSGTVEADGSWNGGPWQTLATTAATGGNYVVRFAITQHGSLKLRVRYPGGEADGAVLVP